MKRTPLITFFALVTIVLGYITLQFDRGSIDRSPIGSEASYWNVARSLNDGTTDRSTVSGTRFAYPSMLQTLATDEPGRFEEVRDILTWLTLPLLAVLVLLLALPRTGNWPAVLAGVSVMLFVPVVHLSGTIDPAIPSAVLIAAALVLIQRFEGIVPRLIAAALTGVAAWFHPPLGTAAGILWVLSAFIATKGRARWLRAGVLGGGWLLGAFVFGLLIQSNTPLPQTPSLEMYRGHRVQASGLDPVRSDSDPGRWLNNRDYYLMAAQNSQSWPSGAEVEKYWRRRAVVEGFTRPDREFIRTLRKTYAALQAHLIPRSVSGAIIQDQAEKSGYVVLLWITRILLPLGVAGLLINRKRLGFALWAGLLTGPAAFLVTYAQPEPRLVTLCVVAVGLGFLALSIKEGQRIAPIIVGATAIAVFGFLPPLLLNGFGSISASDHFTLATMYNGAGQGSAAMREFDRALRLEPENPLPKIGIAGMLSGDQVLDEAIVELEQVRTSYPKMLSPVESLGRLYQARVRLPEAIEIHRELVQAVPNNAEYHNNLGTAYLQAGYFDLAEQSLSRALALSPEYQAAQDNLRAMIERGFALAPGASDSTTVRVDAEQVIRRIRAGDFQGAQEALDKGYARWGSDSHQLIFVEGTLRLQSGNCQEGIRIYESVRPILGREDVFLNNLGAAYTQCGELRKGIEVWQEAVKLNPNNMVIRENIKKAEAQLQSAGG